MVVLNICHRTLPAYRDFFFVHDENWITSRVALYYLDLAVPDEIMFDKVFQKNNLISVSIKKRQFHPDDCISVGCDRKKNSRFYSHALSKKLDRIGMELFDLFYKGMDIRRKRELESGESAVRFLNMATVFGVGMWTEHVGSNDSRSVFKSSREFLTIYPHILKGLFKQKSEHPFLLKKVWDYFGLTDEIRLTLFYKVPDVEHLEFMLKVANSTRFDFWGMRYGSKDFTNSIVYIYMYKQKYKWVELLLKYGFALEKGIPNKTSIQRNDYWSLEFHWDRTISNKFLVWFLATTYARNPDSVKLPGFIELYQKLYRSLPLPSMPQSNLRKNLQQVVSRLDFFFPIRLQISAPDIITLPLEEIIKAYMECGIHPPDNSVVAPRELSHLCRHVLRESLGRNFQLPTAIDDSNLPTFFKRFLNLEF